MKVFSHKLEHETVEHEIVIVFESLLIVIIVDLMMMMVYSNPFISHLLSNLSL